MTEVVEDADIDSLAQRLAALRRVTVKEAVADALRNEIKRAERPLAERLAEIADEFNRLSTGQGEEITKDYFDRMWGHDEL